MMKNRTNKKFKIDTSEFDEAFKCMCNALKKEKKPCKLHIFNCLNLKK